MLHDSKGFLWLATHDGLNRYDGYQFRHFRHDPQDDTSLSHSFVTVIFEDSKGALWIGTKGGGLNRYNPQTQRFIRYKFDPRDDKSLSHNYVTSIIEDSQQQLWVGTLGGGLNRFNSEQQSFSHFFNDHSDRRSLSNNNIRSLTVDNNGLLWIGTEGGGLNKMDTNTFQFSHYRHDPNDPQSLTHDSIYTIKFGEKGYLWLGTFGGGLNRFDPQLQQFKSYRHQQANPASLSNDKIWTLIQDKEGMLWIGTDGGGLAMFSPELERFINYRHQSSDAYSISHDAIRSIYEDDSGIIWIGTLLGGINKVDTTTRLFGHFKHYSTDPYSLSHNAVMTLYEDSQGVLWVGTWGGGLNRSVDVNLGFTRFYHDPKNPHSLSHNSVWSILEDNEGTLWVGTKGGLSKYDRDSGHFLHYQHDNNDPHSLSDNWVMSLYQDSQGILWVGSRGGGLNRFDPELERFTHFKHSSDDPSSLSSDMVMDISEDKQGRLWIGTWGGGVNRFDRNNQKFTRFENVKDNLATLSDDYVMSVFSDSVGRIWVGTFGGGLNRFDNDKGSFRSYRERDGLANDIVYGILEDRDLNLWLSTNRGLSKFNPRKEKFKNYNVNDGLQSNEFNGGASFRSRNGELFFGGINGYNRFYPRTIKDDKQAPVVVFTDFLLFNQSVPVKVPTTKKVSVNDEKGDNSPLFTLDKAIDQLDKLSIGHRQNLVTFEFAALNYANPMSNRYVYKLEGLDKNWIKADAKIRRATYTNLPAGVYTLKVKASNPDMYWNQSGASIEIHVAPPPWRSWWAYGIYFILTTLVILKIIYYRIERGKVRNERMMLQHLKQVDKLKDDFLANTSHELRTPLNGIIGLAESLIDGIDGQLPEKAQKTLSMVVTSGRRLASLINDILDLSKLKHSNIELQRQPVDIRALTDVVLTLSQPLVGKKPVELINTIDENIAAVEADENRLLQILHNLVGNGIKFTDSGAVTISAVTESDFIKICISDTGIGIAEEKFDTIFDSFEQVQGDVERAYGGTGLGLTITRQLVELHGGRIGLTSKLDEGSEFYFTLPICLKKASTAVHAKSNQIEGALIEQLEKDAEDTPVLENICPSEDGSKFRLLLVDDEPINIHVLKNYLSHHHYQMVEAEDGVQALKAIEEDGPFDMVLLDIMMPRMSGYEVCQKIRESYSVSDLPVIFLTASHHVEDVVEGFNVGANDHLHKPVAKRELLSRVGTHLRLLDINRNLELRVKERTELVEQQNQRLELKNAKILSTQKKLILSEKLASLGNLMACVAHEINNPINFVNISVTSLETDIKKCFQFILDLAGEEAGQEVIDLLEQQFKPLKEHTEVIKDGTERLKTIVKDLKTSTHMDDNEKITKDISEILLSTLNLVSAKYKQLVVFETNIEHVPPISCYPSKLNQVFMNLIVNACDALQDKNHLVKNSALDIRANKELGRIIICCRVVDDWVEIKVNDNGCGMTDETKTKLFEPFYTTKSIDEGTGLGLAISYDIIQKHGGELTVNSQLGVGSEFKILLPIE